MRNYVIRKTKEVEEKEKNHVGRSAEVPLRTWLVGLYV
jgi:hypothetical protein